MSKVTLADLSPTHVEAESSVLVGSGSTIKKAPVSEILVVQDPNDTLLEFKKQAGTGSTVIKGKDLLSSQGTVDIRTYPTHVDLNANIQVELVEDSGILSGAIKKIKIINHKAGAATENPSTGELVLDLDKINTTPEDLAKIIVAGKGITIDIADETLTVNRSDFTDAELAALFVNASDGSTEVVISNGTVSFQSKVQCSVLKSHFTSSDGSITFSVVGEGDACKLNFAAKSDFLGFYETESELNDIAVGKLVSGKSYAYVGKVTNRHTDTEVPALFRYKTTGSGSSPMWLEETPYGFSLLRTLSPTNETVYKPIKTIVDTNNVSLDSNGELTIKTLDAVAVEINNIDQDTPLKKLKIDSSYATMPEDEDGVLHIPQLKVLDNAGQPVTSDHDGGALAIRAGTGMTFADEAANGTVVLNAKTGIKANRTSDPAIQNITKVVVDSVISEFTDSNETLKIKSVEGVVGGNSNPISRVVVTGNTSGTSVNADGILTLNIPSSTSGGIDGLTVTGTDYDVDDTAPVNQKVSKLNFGTTMDTYVETTDEGSYVTVDTKGFDITQNGESRAKSVREIDIVGATVTQTDPKSGKAELVFDGGVKPVGIEKGRFSVLTTINDFLLGDVTAGHVIHYQLVQDPMANIQVDNSGGFQVDVTAQYNVEVGLQLIGQNDYVGHTGTFHIELCERQHPAGSYAPIYVAEGDVSAGGTGEFHGKYPLIIARFDSAQLMAGRSYNIMLSTSNLSSSMQYASLDPYKNYLTLDPANGHGTAKAIANTLRNTLGGLSFNVGYEVRAEKTDDQTATPRVYGERYRHDSPQVLPIKTS